MLINFVFIFLTVRIKYLGKDPLSDHLPRTPLLRSYDRQCSGHHGNDLSVRWIENVQANDLFITI